MWVCEPPLEACGRGHTRGWLRACLVAAWPHQSALQGRSQRGRQHAGHCTVRGLARVISGVCQQTNAASRLHSQAPHGLCSICFSHPVCTAGRQCSFQYDTHDGLLWIEASALRGSKRQGRTGHRLADQPVTHQVSQLNASNPTSSHASQASSLLAGSPLLSSWPPRAVSRLRLRL